MKKVWLLQSVTGPPKQFEQRGVGKFGSALDATVHAIHHGGEAGRIIVDKGDREDRPLIQRGRRRATHCQRASVLVLTRSGCVLVDIPDLAQDVAKRRPAIARLFGKICAAPERLARARQKHGEGPAATLTHGACSDAI